MLSISVRLLHTLLTAVAAAPSIPSGAPQPVAAGAPTNDQCLSAIPVTDGIYLADNIGATTSGSATCGFAGVNGAADVWFRYIAPRTGVGSIATCATPEQTPRFDSIISVFNACGGNELACNDDSFDVCVSVSSFVQFPIVQGVSYWIRVAEYDGQVGDFVLSVSSAGNDGCGDDYCLAEESNPTCPQDCASLVDFADFQICFSAAAPHNAPVCGHFDADAGGELNLFDFRLFLSSNFVGP